MAINNYTSSLACEQDNQLEYLIKDALNVNQPHEALKLAKEVLHEGRRFNLIADFF